MTESGPGPQIPPVSPHPPSHRPVPHIHRLGYSSALQRRLGIPAHPASEDTETGLIVIQIDGLAAHRLRRYLNRRYMPFLRGMVQKRQLVIQDYFSQIPTSTPAFQAACFYGTNEGIPGFQFYDKRTRCRYKMGNSANALEIQESLPKPGALAGGTVYSCVFDGDAAGSLFIFSSLLNPTRWRLAVRAWDITVLSILHIGIILRIVFLALFELFLAVAEFPIWLSQTGRLKLELELIGIRVGLLIIGREMITLNSVIDVKRSVPIIYTNYLGYDECGHIRGPDSASARLQLRAIDRCIRRIHRAASRSNRPYQMIVLSDHGQASCIPFEQVSGKPVGPWLEGLLSSPPLDVSPDTPPSASQGFVDADTINDRVSAMASDQAAALRRIQSGYPRALRNSVGRVANALEKGTAKPDKLRPLRAEMIVSISGPTAHVYWADHPEPLTEADISKKHPDLIEAIVRCEGIGCVSLRSTIPGEILLLASTGRATLHADGTRTVDGVLPPDHCSDTDHVYQGIHRIALMPRAGDMVLWGNGARAGEVSFLDEKGCHAGFSDQETGAFVLTPPDCPVPFREFKYHAEFHGALLALRPPPQKGQSGGQ